MKTRTATALSLIGVLAAGTAAALANTHVLSSSAASKEAPDILTINTIAGAPLENSNVPVTASPAAAASSAQVDPASSQTSTNSITTYAVGDAGLVEVRVTSTGVDIANVSAAAGWKTISSSSSAGSLPAMVVFASPSTEVTFAAAFVAGQVVTDVSSRSLAPAPTERHHDDDDDDHDEDHHGGHDDDHHGGHDDDHEEHDDDDD